RAGLWLVPAIGLGSGAGMYQESVLATATGLIALWALRRFEDKEDHLQRRKVSVLLDGGRGEAAGVSRAREGEKIRTQSGEYEHRLEERRVTVTLRVEVTAVDAKRMLQILESPPGGGGGRGGAGGR